MLFGSTKMKYAIATVLALLFPHLALAGGHVTGISGMLACTPKDSQQKPVIYAFDGQYLLRDSDSSAPFKKVVSLYDGLDLYFAFIPTKKTLEGHEGLVRQHKNYQSKKKEISAEVARFKSLHCPKVNKADIFAPYYRKFDGKKPDVGIPKDFHCSSKIEDAHELGKKVGETLKAISNNSYKR